MSLTISYCYMMQKNTLVLAHSIAAELVFCYYNGAIYI